MSWARFLEESNESLRGNSALDSNRALELVRDRWLKEEKHEELVNAVLANWTSGNCIAFMKPISAALLQSGKQTLHRKLWARTIKRQINSAFDCYAHLRALKPSFEAIIEVDSADFDEFDFNAYDDRMKATSFLLKRLVKSLQLWQQELQSRNWSTEEVELILNQVRALKRPRLPVG